MTEPLDYKWEKFIPKKRSRASVKNMEVLEVVVYRNTNRQTLSYVRHLMRRQVLDRKEFSIAVYENDIAVRRDK